MIKYKRGDLIIASKTFYYAICVDEHGAAFKGIDFQGWFGKESQGCGGEGRVPCNKYMYIPVKSNSYIPEDINTSTGQLIPLYSTRYPVVGTYFGGTCSRPDFDIKMLSIHYPEDTFVYLEGIKSQIEESIKLKSMNCEERKAYYAKKYSSPINENEFVANGISMKGPGKKTTYKSNKKKK